MHIPITGNLQLPILGIFNLGELLRQSVDAIEKKLQIFNRIDTNGHLIHSFTVCLSTVLFMSKAEIINVQQTNILFVLAPQLYGGNN